MAFLYNISIIFYLFFIRIASIFNKKAKLWINGRINIFQKINKKIKPNEKIAWFHCASLGEFEQGRPVIEEFKKRNNDFKILITFFSPSGFEVRKNYDKADYIFYLPIDTPYNAKRFIDLVNPSIVFFVKYEFWFNYRKQLRTVSHIFVQNNESLDLLKKINITQVIIAGDTRFDRVSEITKNVKDFPVIQKFCKNSDIFIAGSSWQPDEEILTAFINSEKSNYKFIIAPHIVDKPHIASLLEKIKKEHVVLYSEADEENVMYAKILVVDCIGILSHVYRYGKIAYIGGGFGSGIHNILEAATFGMPVIFGPKYHKFREAVDLIKEGGAYSIRNTSEFLNIVMNFYNNPEILKEKSEIARNFVQKNIGATKIILEETSKFLY